MPYVDYNRDTLIIGHGTDAGHSGKNNEDDYGIFEAHQRMPNAAAPMMVDVAVVADGIGGSNSGEIASKLAVETIADVFRQERDRTISERLELAIRVANRNIFVAARENPSMRGMGTTAVVSAIAENHLYIAHAGDSRAYLLRYGELFLLTLDHTWAQEAIDAGRLTLGEAQQHPNRNVIKRFLGPTDHVEVDHRILAVANRTGNVMLPQHRQLMPENRLPLQTSDLILLCTDGLTDVVDDEQITTILNTYEPQDAVNQLIKCANDAGGPDNITVVLQLHTGQYQSQFIPRAAQAEMPVDATTPWPPPGGLNPSPQNLPYNDGAPPRPPDRRGRAGLWLLLAAALLIIIFGSAFWLNLLPGQRGVESILPDSATGVSAQGAQADEVAPLEISTPVPDDSPAGQSIDIVSANESENPVKSTVLAAQAVALTTTTPSDAMTTVDVTTVGATANLTAAIPMLDMITPTIAAADVVTDVADDTPAAANTVESGTAESNDENSAVVVTEDARSGVVTIARKPTSTSAIPAPIVTTIPLATATPTVTPSPTPTYTSTPEPSATATPSATASATATPTTTPTVTPLPTLPPTPTVPTRTALPTPIPPTRPAPNPSPTVATDGSSSTDAAATGIFAATYPIVLNRPANGQVLKDTYEFEWVTDYPLATGQGLELAFWPVDAGPENWKEGRSPVGALFVSTVEDVWRTRISLVGFEDSQLDGFFKPGRYYWGIRLFDVAAGRPLALVGGSSLYFEYQRSRGDSGSGRNGHNGGGTDEK